MKLKKDYYFNGDDVAITEKGWLDLQNFCKSILYKQYGRKLNQDTLDDLTSTALLACVDNLKNYDKEKNSELGGYLYWIVRGEVTKYLQRVSKEIATDMQSGILEWMEGEQDGCTGLQEYD